MAELHMGLVKKKSTHGSGSLRKIRIRLFLSTVLYGLNPREYKIEQQRKGLQEKAKQIKTKSKASKAKPANRN